MSRADDDSDDEGLEGLGSFRSMFREMPDEEPPQRGFAELMAAARVKADEMAKPSLWERFLQTMRRPQMMALATIMILIGGAVFISQRKSEMDASPTATQSEYEALEKNAATSSAGSAAPMGVAQEAAKLDGDGKEEAQAPADMIGGQGSAAVTTPPAAIEPKRDEKRQRDFGAKGGGGAAVSDAEDHRKAAGPATSAETKAPPKMTKPSPSKAPAKPRASSGTKSADTDLLLEGGFDDGGPTAGAAPSPDPAPTTDKATTGTAKQSTSPTVQQLHASARKLAAAGDCAHVRTIAKQIAAKDAPYYRANIATDTSLASCLK